jgi:hypothetical protein
MRDVPAGTLCKKPKPITAKWLNRQIALVAMPYFQ